MHGTDDKATVCHGSQFFYEHAGSKDKTLKLYKDHYHDLLADYRQGGGDRRHHGVDREAPAGLTPPMPGGCG